MGRDGTVDDGWRGGGVNWRWAELDSIAEADMFSGERPFHG